MAENDTTQDAALDALLGQAYTPQPPADMADRIMASIRQEEAVAAYRRPWFKRISPWAYSSAAILCLCITLLPLISPMGQQDCIAIDDTMVVDEVLSNIQDDELFDAICAVSVEDYE